MDRSFEIHLVSRQRTVSFDKERLVDALRSLERALAPEVPPHSEVSLVLLSDSGIRKLNRQYAGEDAPTDVLSFPLYDDGLMPEEEVGELGDILVSLETAMRQVGTKERYGHRLTSDLYEEVQLLVTHGVLHLMGHDHGRAEESKAMLAAEKRVLERLRP